MSEYLTKYYSIHNLLNIKVNTKKGFFGNNVLNNPLSFFETNEKIDPDIIVNVGKFEPKNKSNYLIDHKYHIDQDYLYFKEKGKSAEWKVEINGLEGSPITINFDGKIFGIYKFLVPDILYYETVLKPLMELVLGLKGYFLAHAGSLSKNNNALLFFGLPGSLKSTIILNGVKKGYKTLGDDKVIIGMNSRQIYSFPIYHQIFDYTVDLGKEELTTLQKFKFLILSNKKNSNLWVKSCIINNAFILKRINNGPIKIKLLENEIALEKLMKNNLNELHISNFPSLISKNNFPDVLLAYCYAYPNLKIANYWNKIKKDLKHTFRNTKFFEIEIPLNSDQNTIEKIFQIIGDDN